MGRFVDLAGQTFGDLTVIARSGMRHSSGGVLWDCRCACGADARVVAASLVSLSARSCGCLKQRELAEKHTKDLTGQIFGILTVIRRTGRMNGKCHIWEYSCACGAVDEVRTTALVSGKIWSCGCAAGLGIRIFSDLEHEIYKSQARRLRADIRRKAARP